MSRRHLYQTEIIAAWHGPDSAKVIGHRFGSTADGVISIWERARARGELPNKTRRNGIAPDITAAILAAWHGPESSVEVGRRLDVSDAVVRNTWHRACRRGELPDKPRPCFDRHSDNDDCDVKYPKRGRDRLLQALMREHAQ